MKQKGIKQNGNTWAFIHLQLEKDREFIILASYTKHGWEIDTTQTLSQVQDYLGTYIVPWVWGGDFNRSPEELLGKRIASPAQAHTPKGEWSTCTVGGMIDYFLTPAADQCTVEECTKNENNNNQASLSNTNKSKQKIAFNQSIRTCGGFEKPEAEPIHDRPTWEQATKTLEKMGWKVPKFSTMNPMQDLYLN